jgi:GrpB-like predicted nucleotidyltransferase (UPF0157 family)
LTPQPLPPALGLARRTVRLVRYDPRWPALYREERERLQRCLGPLPLEHVGSTAVPGLDAKPILDLMLGVEGESARAQTIEPLRRAGYTHGDSDVIPGRLYFRRDDEAALRTHQLSVCAFGGSFWCAHLAFRDALRADAALAAAYLRLKLDLAQRFPTDRIAYSEAKSDFVAAVLRARAAR